MSTASKKESSAVVKVAESAAIALTPHTVRQYICPLATDQEIALFLNLCAMFALNPFKREVHLIKYSAKDPATTVVGYEVYLKRAERTGKWAGMEAGTEDDANGRPYKAWVRVYRRDWERPLYHEVFFEEYCQYKDEWVDNRRTGRKVPTRFWAEKPRTMLKKVAIAQGFRLAFPDEFGGMPYVAEEMPVDHASLPTKEITISATAMVHPEASAAAEEADRRIDEYDALAAEPNLSEAERRAVEHRRHPEKFQAMPRVNDEFDAVPASPPTEQRAPIAAQPEEKAAANASAKPTMKQLEKFGAYKASLASFGIGDDTLWRGIDRFVNEHFGHGVADINDLSASELEDVFGYLGRWEKALIADRQKGKGVGRGK